VIRVATGGGKTEMAVAMTEMNYVSTVFLVHRKDLLIQARDRFNRYGHDVNVIGDSKFEIRNSPVTIATMQTLNRIVSDPSDKRHVETLKLIAGCRQLFIDEAHLMASSLDKGNLFCSLANYFVNATFRWGLTATPFMRAKYDNLLLESATGGLLYDVSSAYLIDKGFLTPPKVRMIKVPGKLEVKREKKSKPGDYWRKVADKGIRFNQIRNQLVANEVFGQGPILCLVATIEQGVVIQSMLDPSMQVEFLTGQASSAERRDAVKALRSGQIDAIMATTIFDEGVDIPEIRKVILASGGKSQVKLLQRIGRGLRLAAGKHSVEIVDFRDEHHHMLLKHAEERLKVYHEEGFEVV
jgi:superfamily II DNA or RNA helicase